MPRKRKKQETKPAVSKVDLSFMLVLLFSIFISTIVYFKSGNLSSTIDPVLGGIFGPAKYIIPIGSFLLCYIMLKDNKRDHIRKIFMYFLIISLFSSLLSIFSISNGSIPAKIEYSEMLGRAFELGKLGKGGRIYWYGYSWNICSSNRYSRSNINNNHINNIFNNTCI